MIRARRFTQIHGHDGQDGSRCTVCGEKAGRHTAMYSAPSGPGVLYRIHSPRWVMTACPASTSITPSFVSTRSIPRRTIVYSSNCGVCPGSTHPDGLCIRAMLSSRAGIDPANEFIDQFRLIPGRLHPRGPLNQPVPSCFPFMASVTSPPHPGHDTRDQRGRSSP